MNKLQLIFILIILTYPSFSAAPLPFDLGQINKHGMPFNAAQCNPNTVIDFAFSSNSKLTFASNVNSPGSSSLRYLDILGNEVVYTLQDGQLVTQTFVAGFSKSFLFKYASDNNYVYVVIPIIDGGNTPTNYIQQTVNLTSQIWAPVLQGMTSLSFFGGSQIYLSAFNFLNDISYGKFYEVMDTNQMVTLLISKLNYKFTKTLSTTASASLFNAALYTFPSASTGDVLCWGSQYSYGFFQTHMRQSVPLWTFLIFVLFFWLFNLLSNQVTPEVYERSFKDNRWTCWSLYSLYWLCHQEWFTRTARSSLLIINFFWQCLVLAAIYSEQGPNVNSGIIIWAAIVAYIASLPMPYLIGNLFFKRVYQIQIQKFETLKQMHHETKKQKHQELQKSAILKEEHIYGIFYFYYAMCIILFGIFGILSVNRMQQLPRNYYYLHWYWLASAGIAFGLDHFVVDPIMTYFFGNKQAYQSRGYYYNSRLGQLAREVDSM